MPSLHEKDATGASSVSKPKVLAYAARSSASPCGKGWLSCHVDQLSYADTTTLPPGSVQMLGRWIALGGLGPDAREQISGRRDWPELPARPGLGVTGRRGAPTVDAIEVPNVDRQAVDDTLALALTADLDTRQDLAGA